MGAEAVDGGKSLVSGRRRVMAPRNRAPSPAVRCGVFLLGTGAILTSIRTNSPQRWTSPIVPLVLVARFELSPLYYMGKLPSAGAPLPEGMSNKGSSSRQSCMAERNMGVIATLCSCSWTKLMPSDNAIECEEGGPDQKHRLQVS